VSEPQQSSAPQEVLASVGEGEELDALPVLAGEPRLVHAQPFPGAVPEARRAPAMMIPAVQAAAVAAGGFVAGAAVVGLVHRRQRRSSALTKGRRGRGTSRTRAPGAARKAGRASELVQIVGSRSLLVDVHLLGGSGDR
jgi:hypothetical protein